MKTILSFFAVLCISVAASAQTNTIYNFRNTLNNGLLKISAMVSGDNDDIYIVGEEDDDCSIIKLDNNNSIVWQTKLNNTHPNWNSAYFSQIEIYGDAVYLLGCLYTHISIVKLDTNGNLLWSKLITASNSSLLPPSMAVNTANGITITNTHSTSIDIISLDLNGNTNWTKNFSTDSAGIKNWNFDLAVTQSGDIIGSAKAQGDMNFYCFGADGNIKWTKRILEEGTHYTRTKCILEISPNRFFICGFRATPLGGTFGDCGFAFYGFIDSLGAFLDLRIINDLGSNAEMKSGILLNNGNILMKGYDSFFKLNFIEIDTLGNIVEAHRLDQFYYTTASELSLGMNVLSENSNYKYCADRTNLLRISEFHQSECFDVVEISITTTGKDPGSAPIEDSIIFQTSSCIINDDLAMQTALSNIQIEDACASMELDEFTTKGNIKFYPTLLTNDQSISIEHTFTTPLQYQIMDLNGKMIISDILENNSVFVNDLSNGIYVLRLISNEAVVGMTKFVVAN